MGGGGFVDGFVYHPTVPGLLYARTDIGGAYRRDGGNESWVPITDGMPRQEDLGILSLALDLRMRARSILPPAFTPGRGKPMARSGARPTRARIGNAPTCRSSWAGTRTGAARAKGCKSIALGRILVLGTSHDGLFRSEDGARTWTQVATFPKVATSFTLFAPARPRAAPARPSSSERWTRPIRSISAMTAAPVLSLCPAGHRA
jgi:hypothetical protein